MLEFQILSFSKAQQSCFGISQAQTARYSRKNPICTLLNAFLRASQKISLNLDLE